MKFIFMAAAASGRKEKQMKNSFRKSQGCIIKENIRNNIKINLICPSANKVHYKKSKIRFIRYGSIS